MAVAAGLLAGWRGGYGAAVVVGVLVTARGGLFLVLGVFAGWLAPAMLPRLVVPVGLGLSLLALLWWPATRRWCGRLPPDPEADAWPPPPRA